MQLRRHFPFPTAFALLMRETLFNEALADSKRENLSIIKVRHLSRNRIVLLA